MEIWIFLILKICITCQKWTTSVASVKTCSIYGLHRTHSVHNLYLHTPTHRITGYLRLEGISGDDLFHPTAHSWVSSDVILSCSVSLETFKDGDDTIFGQLLTAWLSLWWESFSFYSIWVSEFQFMPNISHPSNNTVLGKAWLHPSSEQTPYRYCKVTNRFP